MFLMVTRCRLWGVLSAAHCRSLLVVLPVPTRLRVLVVRVRGCELGVRR